VKVFVEETVVGYLNHTCRKCKRAINSVLNYIQ